MQTKSNVVEVKDYTMYAHNGRRIRLATMIVFKDGSTIKFMDRVSKKLALAQLSA